MLWPPLRVGAGGPQSARPTTSSAASGDTTFQAAGPLSNAGVVEGAFAALAPHGYPSGLRAPPGCRAVWGICPGAALPAPRFPRRRRALGWSCPVAAGVRGALARTEKKRAVFAFANKRELFPSPEAGGAAPGLRFAPPQSSVVAQPPRIPGLRRRAWRGVPGTEARGRGRLWGGGGAGGNAAGLGACKAPPCSFGAAGPTSNKWRRTARAQPPPAEPWARAGAAREPPCHLGRRSGGAAPLGLCLLFTR